MISQTILNLPPQINFAFLKKNDEIVIYLYNDNKFVILLKNKNDLIKCNTCDNTISIIRNKSDNNLIKTINLFNKFLKSLNLNFFFKIKFKGKGYRLRFYKKNKIVKFYFNKSHLTFMFFKNIILRKVNKYKFIIKSTNPQYLNNLAANIIKIKPINKFTLRGLRLSRQKVFKRKGKKGSYI